MKARKFIRFPTNASVSLVIDNMIGIHQLYLNDASQGGLNINAHGCIDRGTLVRIAVSDQDRDAITRGQVAWCQPCGSGYCHLGIKFDQLMNQSSIEKLWLRH